MSKESIKRIYEQHAFQIRRACSEGCGAELLDDFIRAISVDFASTVFLKMDEKVSKAAPEAAEALWAWVQDYPQHCGLELLDSVASTLSAFQASAGQIAAAQQVAATAYQEHLEKLFEEANQGGAA